MTHDPFCPAHCLEERKGQNLSLEDEYDGLKALISLGEEKGYLLYDEVTDALSEERLGSEDLDRILHFLGAAGLEVIDSEHRFEGSRQKIDGKGKLTKQTRRKTNPEIQ